MSVAKILVAILLGGQVLWAMHQGATIFTPACADFTNRLNDQFNSALMMALLLGLGGFWSKPNG